MYIICVQSRNLSIRRQRLFDHETVLYDCDVHGNLSCLLTAQTRPRGRSYSSTTDNILDFYTNKTEQYLHT